MKPWPYIVTLCLLCSQLQASVLIDALSINGTIDFDGAIGLDSGDVQTARIAVTPEFSFDFGASQVTAIFSIQADAVDKLEPGRPSQGNRSSGSQRAFFGDHVEFELRELYLDRTVGDVYMRLGKQQIVWGEADGIKLLDVINPQSFREFILPEFDESRIPLWSANIDIPLNNDFNAQIIWIPDRTYSDIPESGASFTFTSPLLVPQPPADIPVEIESAQRPGNTFSGSDWGGRLYGFLGNWEVSLNYFYHYQDIPVLRREVNNNGITIQPQYERSHLLGGSFNNAFGDFVVRGEFAYTTDNYFLNNDTQDADGLDSSDQISALIGLDYQGISDVFLSAQLYAGHALDHNDLILRDQTETQATFLYEHNFLNDTLKTSVLAIHSLNTNDGVIQAEIEYEYQDNFILRAGPGQFLW